MRYGLTSNLTLQVTANTDFAQVEADDQQVNLTRFSLFFPEKRRFFQERASLFEYSLGGQDRLFHSRTVGLRRRDAGPDLRRGPCGGPDGRMGRRRHETFRPRSPRLFPLRTWASRGSGAAC